MEYALFTIDDTERPDWKALEFDIGTINEKLTPAKAKPIVKVTDGDIALVTSSTVVLWACCSISMESNWC